MAKGFKWVRVQLPERLHDRMMKAKGASSWDDTIARALLTVLDGQAANDLSGDEHREVRRG